MNRNARNRISIVGLGGGTGLSVLLAGLERSARRSGIQHDLDISAIVSVADDGGSSGLLREYLGIPAVGDLRNCLVALSRGNPLWGELFQHRFPEGNGLAGQSLGNLIVAALVQRFGSLGAATARLAAPLRLGGRVLPVTEETVTLCAELEDGRVVEGESRIPLRRRGIRKLWLSPNDPAPAPGVLEALRGADAIVMGPGSLCTSIVPNLLVRDVAETIRNSHAIRIFVANLMTEPGETDGFDVADHLSFIEHYLGPGVVDVVLANAAVPPRVAIRYAEAGAAPVYWDRRKDFGTALPILSDLLDRDLVIGRHDPQKLAEAVVSVARHMRRRNTVANPALAAVSESDLPLEAMS